MVFIGINDTTKGSVCIRAIITSIQVKKEPFSDFLFMIWGIFFKSIDHAFCDQYGLACLYNL